MSDLVETEKTDFLMTRLILQRAEEQIRYHLKHRGCRWFMLPVVLLGSDKSSLASNYMDNNSTAVRSNWAGCSPETQFGN